MARCMLTTFDNPYNPFDDFEKWFLYDVENGYNSCGYLARIAHTSEAFSDEENAKEIERAIDEIISFDIFSVYKKVFENSEVKNSLENSEVKTSLEHSEENSLDDFGDDSEAENSLENSNEILETH